MSQKHSPVVVVGIGASAGGIAALQTFFAHVLASSGCAYAVLHPAPQHEPDLATLLQSITALPVTVITRRVRLEADQIYLVSPHQQLVLTDDDLEVSPYSQSAERRAPVDNFFRALADAHQGNSVAVVLSGDGTDGVLGLKRVKQRGGAVFVQHPHEAAFGELPRAAMGSELFDAVLPVQHIPAHISAYQARLGMLTVAEAQATSKETPRAAMGQALRASEERLRAFVAATSDIVYEMSADWRKVRLFDDKTFIATTEQSRGDWLEEYVPPPEKERVWAAIQNAIATRSPFELEHCVIRLDGTVGWRFSRAIPLFDEAGNITQWFGTASDITERKQAEQALRESEEKYRTLFVSIDEGVSTIEAIFDEQGKAIDYRYLENNPAVKKIFGFEWPVGKTVREFLPEVEDHWIETIGKVARTGEPVRTEYTVESLDRWVSAYFSRVGGSDSRKVVAVYDDITERKQAERQQEFLLRLADALRAETNADDVANRALLMLSEELSLDRCYIGVYRLEDDCADLTHQVGNERVPPLPDNIRLSDFPKAFQVVFNRTLVIEDFAETEGLSDTDKQNIAALGLRALVAPCLRKGENNPLWSIVAVSSRPRRWTQGEISLIEEVAERTWAAIERAKAEEALREREEKYRTLFETIDEGFLIHEVIRDEHGRATDLRLMEVNPAFTQQTGLGPEMVGKRASEYLPNLEEFWIGTCDRVARTGIPERMESFNEATDRWYSVHYSRAGREDCRVAIVFEDITERKRREASLAFLAEVSQELVRLTNIGETMEALSQKIAEYFDASVCSFTMIDEAAGTMTQPYAWQRAGLPSVADTFRLNDFHTEEFRRACRAGETYVVRDTATDAHVNGANMAAVSVGAFVSVPLMHAGEWRFNLSVADDKPRAWRDDEIELLRELSTRIWTRLERARAEQALRESEELLRTVATNAPVIIFALDKDGVFTLSTGSGLTAIGLSSDQVVGQSAFDLYADYEGIVRDIHRSLAGETHIATREVAGITFETRYAPLYDTTGAHMGEQTIVGIIGVATNVTERVRAETALRESQKFVQGIISSLPLAVYIFDLQARKNLYLSPQIFDIFGYTVEAIQASGSQLMPMFFHPDEQQQIAAYFETIAAAQKDQIFSIECRMLHKERGWIWVMCRDTVYARDANGTPIQLLGTAEDISVRKQSEEALERARNELELRVVERTAELRQLSRQRQELLQRLMTAQEDERQRIARELHDSLGQFLSALTIRLTTAANLPDTPPALKQSIEQLQVLARQTDGEVDRLTMELRPPSLDDMGLMDALASYTQAWTATSGVPVDILPLNINNGRLPPVVEATVYRIVQEALTNVLKHAQATQVSIIVERRAEKLRVVIEDNGRGFDPHLLSEQGTGGRQMGLIGMVERARLVDGELQIESEDSQGTAIYLSIPLAENNHRQSP